MERAVSGCDVEQEEYVLLGSTCPVDITAAGQEPPSVGKRSGKPALFTNLVESYQDEYLDLFDTFLTQNIDSQWLKTWFLKESSMIAPYVKKDPSAYVSFEEHELAVNTLYQLCVDRSKSIRSQLEGSSAISLNDLEENPKQIETSVNIPDLGNLQDLENAYDKNQILKEKLLSTSPKD